jgi:hypothetical protein
MYSFVNVGFLSIPEMMESAAKTGLRISKISEKYFYYD